ncbi:MAG: YiiX/YebB-like N1pC/P60 family cysteine hydrolase [Desulfobacula sp.]|nr:YiiX/YebB-like N1pC/P60 family cysteine hydrolase [Desulfobacula sp.]
MIASLRKFILEKLEKQKRQYEQRAYNNLSKLYGIIQPGDILLVEGRSEMSRLIKLFSSSNWSHVAMYGGNKLINSDHKAEDLYLKRYGEDANHMLVEAFSGKGVIATPLKKYKDYNIRLCRPYGILDSDLRYVIEQVIGSLGMRYDDQNIMAIALMAVQALWRPKNNHTLRACLGNCNDFQVICSGMIAQAFQSVGYPIVPALLPQSSKDAFDENNPYGGGLIMRHYTQVTPKDFDLSPNFEVIKYNIMGDIRFDYKSLWAKQL